MPAYRSTAHEFRSDLKIAIMFGVVLAIQGFFALTMSIAFASEGAPALLGLAGVLLLILSATAFTYRGVVRIDGQAGRVLRSRRALVWMQVREFPLADFNGVGVGMAGRRGTYGSSTSYFVQLLGPTNLNLPGLSGSRDATLAAARELADDLGLPMDEKPRTVFFQMRF